VEQVTAGGERRRSEAGVVREGEQRVEIGAARVGDEDRQLVHHRFPCQLDARDQPPHRRMEPENGTQDLLGDQPRPVAAADVVELVRDDGALRSGIDRLEGDRQQDHGPPHAKRDGMTNLRRPQDRRADADDR
jgi:hypothetical protein